jgi:hypothetical protein
LTNRRSRANISKSASIVMKKTFALLALLTNLSLLAAWTPPENPNPQQILDEAQADAKAGRYEDALAKHVWFHENALKLQPALYGVRLSFALGYWAELGAAYPPALEKLKSTRDQAADRVRESDQPHEAFNDFASINETLKESGKTKDLFIWLESHKPQTARELFDLAKPALIRAKEYRLCGRYLDPDKSFEKIRNQYREDKRMALYILADMHLQEFGEKSFANETATLVALLVVNDRKSDANRIAAEALKERNDPPFKAELQKAKQGAVPAPWP